MTPERLAHARRVVEHQEGQRRRSYNARPPETAGTNMLRADRRERRRAAIRNYEDARARWRDAVDVGAMCGKGWGRANALAGTLDEATQALLRELGVIT